MLAAPLPTPGESAVPSVSPTWNWMEGSGAAGKVHPPTAACAVGRRADGPSLPTCHSWFSLLGPPPFHFLP